MGQTQSITNTVKPELLVSELIGEVKDDDYFARSINILDNFVMDDPTQGIFNPADAIALEDAHLLANPGYLNLEHGYVRLPNGCVYVAVLTDFGYDVNGEMFDWWFRQVDNKEKYRWWHPKDHIDGAWDPQFYAVMPQERTRGHYITHVHSVKENIGGTTFWFNIEFERPSKYFDVTKFEEQGITACLVARVFTKDSTLGVIAVAHLMHIVREVDGKSELRSRFWLGDIHYPETVDNLAYARIVNSIANTYLARIIKIPILSAKGLWIHCSEEMHCLKEILPDFYKRNYKGNQEEIIEVDL